ncbi:actin related protein 2/3 complex [Tieghemostelium lacteum]|uniref:Actin-related protein 2/3 complex subunit n=1 Tax=Tieghemostelium lacteum TaxID=361077 RepID=A0A151Z9E3_TIELA|nr:actin related protein 2/3 complex [Tieghemostelium lacteum]|eukprot:KYQ90570.1 actin related protein 2/3 complex [Tieghemostelium lacteum]
MSAFEIEHLATCITAHAWNADRSRVAICPNNNEVHIFAKKDNSWVVEHVLTEHDQVVTSIDWAPKTNRILTASQDRNAYVWTFAAGQWKPVLVLLRINRAATHVKWSPQENKFAVASGAKLVCICFFEEEHDWWASTHIRKHKSTVLKVDWHPNNLLLATASSDFKVRVFDAFIKKADGRVTRPYGEIPFGDPIFEFDQCASWVHACKWSPSGNTLAFASHDSNLAVANFSSNPPTVEKIKLRTLPLCDLLYLTENSIVGVGYDCTPVLITNSNGWTYQGELDKPGTGAAATSGAEPTNARKLFQNKVDLGDTKTDTKLSTAHQNCITTIVPTKSAGGLVSDFSTSGLDGNVVQWHTKVLETKSKLKVI